MEAKAPTGYWLGDVRIDLHRREVLVSGRPANVQRLTCDLLAYFVANAGRVILKEELLDKVWKNPVGADEIIARGVMKVRHAIGDSAKDPRILRTVRGKGYMLDRGPQPYFELSDPKVSKHGELAALNRAIALLPCRNRTGDRELDWVEYGVPSLVQQSLGSSVQLVLAPAGWPSAGVSTSLMQAACEALGAAEVLDFELQVKKGSADSPREFHLVVRQGCDERTARRTEFGGTIVGDLVAALTQTLVASPPISHPGEDRTFWDEQLAKAHDLDRRGAGERALALMEECVARLPPSVEMWLSHAAMLRKVGRREEGGIRARAALELAKDAPPHLHARALFEMASQACSTLGSHL